VTETARTVDVIWRIESARLIAGLTRIVRDVGIAEDLAQDALVAALETWPTSGVPENPGAWLMATAKNRAIDVLRRAKRGESRQAALERDFGARMAMAAAEHEAALRGAVEDDLLGLVFMCCHPVLSTEARVALTLRLVGGLTTAEIARAFLVSEVAMGQRITRAKRTLADAKVPFEVPGGDELDPRLASVLEVVYLIINEGYSATAGSDWLRPALCEDALRLARVLAGLMANESEVHGLAALLEIQASRTRARTRPEGEPVLLLDQDRGRWDQLLIRRGLAALARAEAAGPLGPYGVQAAIAACHARARAADETDWRRIAALYDTLPRIAPSPIVELNRAVAVGLAAGPEAGLTIADALRDEPALREYHLLPSVRADLLTKLGRTDEARAELERAAGLTQNERERTLLLRRADALPAGLSRSVNGLRGRPGGRA